MMTKSKQAKSYKPMFNNTSRRRVFVELLHSRERERIGWCGLLQEHVRNTRRGGEFRSDRHGHIDEHETRGLIFLIRACANTSKDIRLCYHGDDFVRLADESDLQWFAKELAESLIVKARGVLGGDEGDLKKGHSAESYRAVRTNHKWLATLWMGSRYEECGNHHGNARSETCGWHRSSIWRPTLSRHQLR